MITTKTLLIGFVARMVRGIKKRRQEVFLCDHCGHDLDIEERIFDNCCSVCASSLGYDRAIYWADGDTLIVRKVK